MNVQVNEDDFNIIQLVKTELNMEESKAVAFILEVGLINMITSPCGNPTIDKLLKQEKYKDLVAKLKAVWRV